MWCCGCRSSCCRSQSAASRIRTDRDTSVLKIQMMLLARELYGEFAVTNALAEIVGITGGGFLAIGRDQFGKGKKQRSLGQAIAFDAVMCRLGPGILKIAKRQAFLVALGQGATKRDIRCAVVIPVASAAGVPLGTNEVTL